jgi:hypothetical protein
MEAVFLPDFKISGEVTEKSFEVNQSEEKKIYLKILLFFLKKK